MIATMFPQLPRESDWKIWLGKNLLAVGLALLLAGIVFFFAFNWTRISPWLRFGLAQSTFILSAACAILLFPARGPASRLAGLTAAVLSGVFWAVFGQIYQTGADAWQFFTLWILFILPWLALHPGLSLWLLLLVVANTALTLWYVQHGLLRHDSLAMFLSFQALNGGALMSCLASARLGAVGAKTWLLAPLPLFLTYATYMVCLALLGWHDPPHSFLSLFTLNSSPFFYGLICLALILLPALKLRHAPSLYLLALCGFPILNILLSLPLRPSVRYFTVTSDWLIYALANIAYTLFLAKSLPHVSLARTARPLSALLELGKRRVLPGTYQGRPLRDAAGANSAPCTTSDNERPAGRKAEPHGQDGLKPGSGYQFIMTVAAFLSALFLALFVGFFVYSSDFPTAERSLAGFIGMLFLSGGAGLYWKGGKSSFIAPLSLCLSLVGLLCMVACLKVDNPGLGGTLTFGLLTLGLYFVSPHPALRFLSVLASLLMAFYDAWPHYLFSYGDSGLLPFLPFLLLLCLCMLPLFAPALGRRLPSASLPATWAALLCLVTFLPSWRQPFQIFNGNPGTFLAFHFFTLGLVCLPLAGMILVRTIPRHAVLPAVFLMAALAILSTLTSSSVILAILLLALGHAVNRRSLTLLGVLVLIASLGMYYYTLDLTLLRKAGHMCLSGLVLLAGALTISLLSGTERRSAFSASIPRLPKFPAGVRPRLMAALLLLSLAVFQYAILDKEKLLASGEEILLAMRPVDPRSLMQGDYMALEYTLERQIQPEYGGRGYAVLRRIPLPNGRMQGEYRESRASIGTLESDEIALAWHGIDSWNVRLALPHSFLFQEGHATVYENAEYAVLRCTPHGTCLLTRLAGRDGEDLSIQSETAP